MEGSAGAANRRENQPEIQVKNRARGPRIFIKKRIEPAKSIAVVSLRSLAKAFGIISEKKKKISVVMTVVQSAELWTSANSRAAMTVATEAAAVRATLLPIRMVDNACSKLLTICMVCFARRLPSSALFLILIVFSAVKALSVPAKYAPHKTNKINTINKGILSLLKTKTTPYFFLLGYSILQIIKIVKYFRHFSYFFV